MGVWKLQPGEKRCFPWGENWPPFFLPKPNAQSLPKINFQTWEGTPGPLLNWGKTQMVIPSGKGKGAGQKPGVALFSKMCQKIPKSPKVFLLSPFLKYPLFGHQMRPEI